MPTTATPKQLTYLKALAERTGQTFTYPHTQADASREINRLRHTRPESRRERYHERKAIADQIHAGPVDAARVREDEIHGRGSTATWTQNRPQDPPVPEQPATRPRRRPVVGARTDLARYTAQGQQRIIHGQRVDGVVRVTDSPAEAGGRAYLIERGLETKAELDAMVADYLQRAAALGAVPMSIVPVEVRA